MTKNQILIKTVQQNSNKTEKQSELPRVTHLVAQSEIKNN